MAPLLKLLCAFVMAILAVMSAGDHSGGVAARPVRLHGTDTEAWTLRERGDRLLVVFPWSARRRAADEFRVSKQTPGAGSSGVTHDPNTHH
jgi:hypothetical protein